MATICCILGSHQELSLKFVRAGGHYTLIPLFANHKKNSAPRLMRLRHQ